jgi:hypothetical protein
MKSRNNKFREEKDRGLAMHHVDSNEGVEMKVQKPRLWSAYGFLALLILGTATTPVSAQSSLKVTATVPFDFYVGNERLPAGEYTFGGHATGQRFLVVKEVDDGGGLITLAQSAQVEIPRKEGALIFRRYDDQYFLYQVWTIGWVSGYEMAKSRTERSVEEDFKQSQAGADVRKSVEFVTITDIAH